MSGNSAILEGSKSLAEQFAAEVGGAAMAEIEAVSKRVDAKLSELSALVGQTQSVKFEFAGKATEIEGIRHAKLEELVRYVAEPRRKAPLLTGPAGSGKSYSAGQVATALDLPFYCQSVSGQTSKSDLFGYMSATGEYVPTLFRVAYETGGVFLLDEIDAGNPNVIVLINDALANGRCGFPDGMVKRHADFRFMASANTRGMGADRSFVGRNQLDMATLTRFRSFFWDYDREAEKQFVAPYGTKGKAWRSVVEFVRERIEAEGVRSAATPRELIDGAIELAGGTKFTDVFYGQFTTVADDKLKAWEKDACRKFNATLKGAKGAGGKDE